MKRILFPTDFSACSTNAFRYAREMAEYAKAEITVLHVYQMSESTGVQPSMAQMNVFEKKEETWFNSLMENFILQEVDQRVKDHSTQKTAPKTLVVGGPTVETIVVLAEKYDLVIMGTHGSTELSNVFLGSISSKVAEFIPIPLLLVPSSAKYKEIKTIVYALSLMGKGDISNIDKLIAFARPLFTAIKCVHITEIGHSSLDELHALMLVKNKYEDYHKHFLLFKMMEGRNILEGLKEYLVEVSADILAIGRKKKGYFEQVFGKHLTQSFFHHPLLPFIILPN